MDTVGSDDAKARLAEFLDRVAEGHSILITRNGRPAACLKPVPGGRARPSRTLLGIARSTAVGVWERAFASPSTAGSADADRPGYVGCLVLVLRERSG